jgi:hypothetical protein
MQHWVQDTERTKQSAHKQNNKKMSNKNHIKKNSCERCLWIELEFTKDANRFLFKDYFYIFVDPINK